jgi:hypothetical protein
MHCNYHGKAIAQKKIKKIDLQLALDSKYWLILKSRLPSKAPKWDLPLYRKNIFRQTLCVQLSEFTVITMIIMLHKKKSKKSTYSLPWTANTDWYRNIDTRKWSPQKKVWSLYFQNHWTKLSQTFCDRKIHLL